MSIKIGLAVRIHENRYVINQDYVAALRKAGAQPIAIFPAARHELSACIAELDGILIPGGWDIHPQCYGEEIDKSQGTNETLDALDIDLIQLALAQHMPVLGICRGLQAINVALGGSLFQDIPSLIKASHDHAVGKHPVFIHPASRLSSFLPKEIQVNSFHHQAIKRLSPLLHVVAKSDDGIIEAVEGEHILAVQWHPERMIDQEPQFQLFVKFVEMCRK